MFSSEQIFVVASTDIVITGLEVYITLFLVHFPPYWRSDLLPAICIVFKEPNRIAPQMDLSRVARFFKHAR